MPPRTADAEFSDVGLVRHSVKRTSVTMAPRTIVVVSDCILKVQHTAGRPIGRHARCMTGSDNNTVGRKSAMLTMSCTA